jgi:hypothetical protein
MLKNVQEELNRFAKYVIKQSRTNLTKGMPTTGKKYSKNDTKKGYDSLDSSVKVSKNSFELSFMMEDYLVFQDRGVKGTKSGKSLDNFSYKQSSNLVGVEYHTGTFAKWAKRKGVQFRNKKGRYVTHEQTGYMLANIVKKKGVKASLFFTKPFEKAFKNIDKDLIKAYKLDVEALMKNSINNK